MRLSVLAMSFALSATFVATARAECVSLSPDVVIRYADAVFSGTLVKREPLGEARYVSEVLTFKVARIWKSERGPRRLIVGTTIKVLHSPHAESYEFQFGREYVLLANILAPAAAFPGNLPDEIRPRYETSTCGEPRLTPEQVDKGIRDLR